MVRFLTGSKWLELDAGGTIPVGTDRYARAGKNGDIFLISSQAYDDLDKNLTALRRKELFSWQPDQVKDFQIKWKTGGGLEMVRQGDTSMWKSKTQPDLKISEDKVDNLLEGLHWLRAADFLAKNAMSAAPDIDVKFELKDGKTAELRLALPGPGIKQAIASSSELDCPVLLSTYFLSNIPRTADSLVDRSLLSSNPSDIKKITWKTAASSGGLVRMEGENWGRVEGAGRGETPQELMAGRQFPGLRAYRGVFGARSVCGQTGPVRAKLRSIRGRFRKKELAYLEGFRPQEHRPRRGLTGKGRLGRGGGRKAAGHAAHSRLAWTDEPCQKWRAKSGRKK